MLYFILVIPTIMVSYMQCQPLRSEHFNHEFVRSHSHPQVAVVYTHTGGRGGGVEGEKG